MLEEISIPCSGSSQFKPLLQEEHVILFLDSYFDSGCRGCRGCIDTTQGFFCLDSYAYIMVHN